MSDIKIDKVNEVYNRVQCDDMGIIMELFQFFSFYVPGYKFIPSYRAKLWDGKIRLLDANTGRIYAGLEKYIEVFAKERGYSIEFLYDNSAVNFSVAEAQEFLSQQKFTLEPRDYQVSAFVDAVRYNRCLFLSPTASGKSFIIYMILRYYLKTTLLIVPTTSLVHQMYSDFADYGFNSDKYCHKIYQGQDKETDKPVTISTWQSLYKLPKQWFDRYDVVIGDEAHLFKSKSLSNIMSKLTDCRYRYGFTGTLDGTKTHKLVLEGLFGPVNQVTTTKKLMDEEHLADFKIKIISLTYSDQNKKEINALTYQNEMDFLVSHEGRNNFIKNLAMSLEGNTLLLFQYVDKHGKILYNMINDIAKDRKVFFVYGGVSGEERDEIRKIVEEENDAIIIASYGTFSTGVNIRNLHSVIFASPSKSKIRNLQSIGRSLRKSSTKEKAVLYDIADDLTWKKSLNFTMRHLIERVKIYDEEEFEYKFYKVGVE